MHAPRQEPALPWSVTLDDHGFLFFAVVREPATAIVLRLVVGLG